jgi:hypothetical protein
MYTSHLITGLRQFTGIIVAMAGCVWLSAALVGAEFPVAEEYGPIFSSTASEARRIEPGKSYIEILPERRRSCVKTAYREFGRDGSTEGLVMEARLLAHCYLAMIARIEELYYKTPNRPEDGISARARALSAGSYSVFYDIYWSTRQCVEQPEVYCGTMHRVLPYDDYLHLVTDLMDVMANHVAREVERLRDFAAWRTAWNSAERFPK